jgi:hypothetical protein
MHGEKRNAIRVMMGKSERKRPVVRPKYSGRIILRWILERQEGEVWTVVRWLRTGNSGGLS